MISIIIPVLNQHEMTNQCIASIETHTVDYELIIVDNGSDPIFEGAAIWHSENLGFPVAVNQGIKAAKGDIICLLNNDTIVTPGWSERLSSHLDQYAIVGPMTNYVAGLQKAQTASYSDEQSLNEAADTWATDHVGIVQEVNFVIGFCMMFKKSLFEELGDFDESMWPCSGEEIDFCLRARNVGHEIGIVQDVYIHHYGSQTFTDLQIAGQLSYKVICKECNEHLAKKWGDDFWQRQGLITSFSDKLTRNARLNLGCGIYHLDGFINVDQYEEVKPDLVSDVFALPVNCNSVGEIYCGHMLEHLNYEEGLKVLRYWYSLLTPGGKITITVPNFDYLICSYLMNPTPEALRTLNDTIIYSYCQRSHHRYCYSGDLLKMIMGEAGFVGLKKLPLEHPYFTEPVKWQIAYEGRRA